MLFSFKVLLFSDTEFPFFFPHNLRAFHIHFVPKAAAIKIANGMQTPLFRKMKSLNAITKRNCSQIIQESGERTSYIHIPFSFTETMCALHHFGILIIGLGVPHQKRRSEGLVTWCTCHIWLGSCLGIPVQKTSANE